MKGTRGVRLVATGVILVALAATWRLVAPMQIGGGAFYVITHGISMEPEYEEGDLVLLRSAEQYLKGDIIGYRSAALDRIVVHRVDHVEGDYMVTKGDNNGWLDSDRPTDADVIGKAWVHLPGVGSWLAKARSPAVASTLIGLVALSFFVGNQTKRSRRAKKGNSPQLPRIAFRSFTQEQKTWLAIPAGLLLAFLVLVAISFRLPVVSAVTSDAAYEHVGRFDYSATVPKNPVYPTGKVQPDRPVFLRIVDTLRVTFDYKLKTNVPNEISGEGLLLMRVKGATGWTKTTPLQASKAFEGDQVRLAGEVDFGKIERLSRRVQRMTGLPEAGQTIEISPRVTLRGDLAGEAVSEQFEPSLALDMDALQVKLAPEQAGARGADPQEALLQKKPGEVSISETRANDLALLGVSFDIKATRGVSLAGSVLALLVLGFLWMRFSNPAHADEASLIETRYSEWLIPVESMRAQSQHKAVQVKSMEALVRLAELYERMILHEASEGIHSYFVEEEGVVYYYQAMSDPKAAPPPTSDGVRPVPAPRFSNHKLREERRKEQAALLRKELADIESQLDREDAAQAEE